MRRIVWMLSVCMAFAASALFAQSAAPIAFVDVNVIPMDKERVLTHQTVIVRGDSIATMGPASSTEVPAGAVRIEGNGTRFLLPGLADMHVHLMSEEDLALYTANGVTTVLDMGGAPAFMVAGTNGRVDGGVVVGPHAFFSMLIDGSGSHEQFFVTTPELGRSAVNLARTNGYHFIKLYNDITADEFAAIVEEAARLGLPVIGHGVRAVGLPEGLARGQVMVAHAEEFFYTAFGNRTDPAMIASVAAATARTGAFVTPNLSTFETLSKQWGKPHVAQEFVQDKRAKYMSPSIRVNWTEHNSYIRRGGSIEGILGFLKRFTRALHEAGVPLLAGTDSPLPGMYPGYSIHEDLRTLVEAGLTPYDAMVAATRTPGEFIARYLPDAHPFGVIRPGMKADLILVRANPLENVERLKSPLGVMSAGRWRTAEELAAILRRQAATYDAVMK